MANEKGREFKGIMGGASYERWATLFGMGRPFYRAAIGDAEFAPNAHVLDLGCGTGSLSGAIAEKLDHTAVIHGIDISDDQLNYAREQHQEHRCKTDFIKCSMDALSFGDGCFDVVITSMALHETPPAVRRGAIKEAARVLKRNGIFILVDWSRPKLGLLSAIWLPFLFFSDWKDNWNNVYCQLCDEQGLKLREDYYVNSLVRRQLFVKY